MATRPSDPQPAEEPLNRLARFAARLLDAPFVVLGERERGSVRVVAGHGVEPHMRRGLEAMLAVLGTGDDPAPAARAAGVAAWISAPVGDGGDGVSGWVLVADRRMRRWTDIERDHLSEIGVLAADAVRRGSERAREAELRRTQRIEAVVQLAGGIAHDFNNLLTAILGSTEILLGKPELEPDGRDDVEQIRKAATRAAQLTHQLLAFSQRQVLQPRLLDLNEVVHDMARLLRRVLGEAVEVDVSLAPALAPVLGDRAKLEQSIVDLALRARDAMPAGGRLRLATAPVEIDQARVGSGIRPGRYSALEIRDTGTPITRAALDRVFEPFGHGAGETGLGLASVHGMVRQSGGYVSAASEPGQGTTFTILLAAVEHQETTADVAPDSADGGETILLVEDEEQIRNIAQRVLDRAGYTVLAAPDGQTAVALANRHPGPIHLLIVDMMLPGLSGRELAAQLTIHRPAIKVLYISGTTDDAIARHRVLAPSTEFLQKPFALTQLIQKIRKVLDAPLARS
ncbi:MAG TPA: response regulator [Gemmatimonadales bacterium]|nr:response regulator [Gemmatimonadales bacterium]